MWNIPSYEWQSHIQKLAGYTLEVKVSQSLYDVCSTGSNPVWVAKRKMKIEFT